VKETTTVLTVAGVPADIRIGCLSNASQMRHFLINSSRSKKSVYFSKSFKEFSVFKKAASNVMPLELICLYTGVTYF
jgi:hypothetical protein